MNKLEAASVVIVLQGSDFPILLFDVVIEIEIRFYIFTVKSSTIEVTIFHCNPDCPANSTYSMCFAIGTYILLESLFYFDHCKLL